MSDTRAVVGIVAVEYGPDHFLKHVDVFIGRPGTGKTGQRLTSVCISDPGKSFGDEIQRRIPVGRLKGAGFGILDQRSADALRRIDEVKGSTSSLDTQQAAVGGAVGAFHIHDPAVFDDEIHLAAHRTVRAGGPHFFHFPFLFPNYLLLAHHDQQRSYPCR